jgi:hypothetical protein
MILSMEVAMMAQGAAMAGMALAKSDDNNTIGFNKT